MRFDWLPASAASLVVGATGLFYVARTLPRPDGAGEVLKYVADMPDGLLSPAVILMLSGTAFIFGLPSVFTLFRCGAVVGVIGLAAMLFGGVSLVGFSHQLLAVRSLALQESVADATLSAVMADSISGDLLALGYLAFYVGELLVAWELLRGRGVPRWVPILFLLHVGFGILALPFEPGVFRQIPSLFMTAALAGAGIVANLNNQPRHASSRDIAAQHARENAA